MAKRILVTGAGGFIGSSLAAELSRRGHDVVGLDSMSKADADPSVAAFCAAGSTEYELRKLDMCTADLAVLGSGFDEAYHIAATVGVAKVCAHPYETLSNNAVSTLRFVEWAREAVGRRVVFASSCENFAQLNDLGMVPVPTPERVPLGVVDLDNPRWSYAVSKLFGESVFFNSGLEFAVVRYFNVYGPAMFSTHAIPELFSKIWLGQSPLQVASASHTRSFCFVEDAVAGTMAAMEHLDARDRVVNVGNANEEISIGDLARRMIDVAGADAEVASDQEVWGSVRRRVPDTSQLLQLLGADYAYTPLSDGLRLCWDWQRANEWVPPVQ